MSTTQLKHRALDGLTIRDLCECFKNEILGFEDEINEWIRLRSAINTIKYKDDFHRIFALRVFDMTKPNKKIEALRQMKIMMGVIEAPKGELDKDKAKKIPIISLYAFKKIRTYKNRATACCPFHQDSTPSFLINADNTFKCFSCGKSGDSIQFLMELNGLGFKDAVNQLTRGTA